MNRDEKNTEIANLTESFKNTKIALCADFRGLNVSKITALRKELTNIGTKTKVVKNTLAKISAKHAYNYSEENNESAEVQKFLDLFVGPTVLIYSFVDPVSPAKIIAKFKKENENFKVKGAFVDGSFVESSGVDSLATMPGKEEILSQLLRLILTPATNLVRIINAPSSKTVQVVDAYRRKLEEEA